MKINIKYENIVVCKKFNVISSKMGNLLFSPLKLRSYLIQ